MNDSSEVHEDTITLPKQVDHQPKSANVKEKMIVTVSNPPIQQDTIDDLDRSLSTTQSMEYLKTGRKRKSRLDASSPSVNNCSIVNDTVAESDTSTASTVEKSTGRWTIQEHESFVRGLSMYGREWKRVAQIIPTRTAAQVRSHAQKYFQHLEQSQQPQFLQHQHAIDFNDDGCTHDANHVSSIDGTMSSNQTSDREGPIEATSMMLNSMSDSVREEAARIMANPTSVHHEVNLTLQQLRQRYRELQNRLAQIQSKSVNSSTPSKCGAETDNHRTSFVSSPSLQMDEQIVVEVLQARLQQHTTRTTIPPLLYDYGNLNPDSTASHHHPHPDQELNGSAMNRTDENPSDYDGDIETDNDEMNI